MVAELLQVLDRQLLHLVGGVAGLEVVPQAVALDRLGQHHRRPAVAQGGGVVGGVDLAVVVPAALHLQIWSSVMSLTMSLVAAVLPKKLART